MSCTNSVYSRKRRRNGYLVGWKPLGF